jgi:choline dehydrogenase-like flavoprotein
MPPNTQAKEYMRLMDWTDNQYICYMQTALDMMPLQSAGCGETLYDTILSTLDKRNVLRTFDEFNAKITPNSASYVSIAMFPDETRWSSAYLLDDSIKPSNLDVKTNWHTDKILFSESNSKIKAIGVKSDDGKVIHADEILLTAGSLGTPAILQRSGIGPRSVLEKLGIKPIVCHDEIGHGVDHTEIAVTYNSLSKLSILPILFY